MMDYYQPGQKVKVQKSINTNVVIYIGDLPPDVDQFELHQFIQAQGKFNVESLIVKPTKDNKSYAYVKFKSKSDAERARKLLNLKAFKDYVIKAEAFRTKNSENNSENLNKNENSENSAQNSNNTNIFVKNLPKETTPRELFELFEKFGNIASIKLKQNINGECLGYGYVNYEENQSAENAIKELNDFEYNGKRLLVNHFSSKKERIGDDEKFPLVLVKKLPSEIKSEKQLHEIFGRFGQILICGIIKNQDNQNIVNEDNSHLDAVQSNTSMAVILFADKESASVAVHSLNETIVENTSTPIIMSLAPINKETMLKLQKAKIESLKSLYEGCNLVVKNIPKEITEKNLFEICKTFGDVKVARIATEGKMKEILDKNGNLIDKEFVYESKGYGFVLFSNNEAAARAKEMMNQPIKFKDSNLSFVVEYYDYNKGDKKEKFINKNKENRDNRDNFSNRENFNNFNKGDNIVNQNGFYSNKRNLNNNKKNFNNKRNFNKNNESLTDNNNNENMIINNRVVINPKYTGPVNNRNIMQPGFNNSNNMNANMNTNVNQNTSSQFRNNFNNNVNQKQMNMMNMRNMQQNMQQNMMTPNNINNNFINNPNLINKNFNNNQNEQINQNMNPLLMNSQISQINSQMSQISPFGNPTPQNSQDLEFLQELDKLFKIPLSDERTELLGESIFYYLLRFISKHNLNSSFGRFDDPTLCSKLTGMFLSIEEKDLVEILSNQEILVMTIKDVLNVRG